MVNCRTHKEPKETKGEGGEINEGNLTLIVIRFRVVSIFQIIRKSQEKLRRESKGEERRRRRRGKQDTQVRSDRNGNLFEVLIFFFFIDVTTSPWVR